MKAHKKIVLWTFWLSILLLIATVLIYIFQPIDNPNYYQWLETLTIGILTSLMVSCIVEIGNYSSHKNKLFEKLFSECLTFYNFLTAQQSKVEEYLNAIDQNKIAQANSINASLISSVNFQLQQFENYTKHGDFSFISTSDRNLKNKRNQYISTTILCLNKFTFLSSQAVLCNNYLNQNNICASYIEAVKILQFIANLKIELDNCLNLLENIHKFDLGWAKALKTLYVQNERKETNDKITTFGNNANKMQNANQAMSMISDLTTMVAQNSETEEKVKTFSNSIQKNINTKKGKSSKK